MQRKISVRGKVYSVFKGTFARVVKRTPKDRPPGWEVRITDCGLVSKKIFPLEDLRTANDYARAAENERLFSQGSTIRDADRAAVNEYRRWEQAIRETGHPVPSLLEIVMAAQRNFAARAAASTWPAARDAYIREKENSWTPRRATIITSFFEKFTAALPDPAAILDDISVDIMLAAVENSVKQGAAQSTKRLYIGTLSSVWSRAVEKKLANFNTASECARILDKGESREEITFLTVPESLSFLRAAAAMPKTPAVFSLVLALLTGIRQSERFRLQWRDFRLDEPEPYINLPQGKAKTRQHRAVYLHGTHAALLKKFFPHRRKENDLIIPAEKNESKIRAAAAAIAAAAGIKLSRNILRHTASTYLCAHLGSYGAAAMILGNSESILKKHYAGLVTRAAAAQFFEMDV